MNHQRSIAKINNVNIIVIEQEKKPVPIKPICEALGVDYSSQLQKIKEHEIFSSVMVLSTTTGADQKQYKMQCLPMEYIFGWIFSINPKNVSQEAHPTVLMYQHECNHALYCYFTDTATFIEQKDAAIKEQLAIVKEAKRNFTTAKTTLKTAEDTLHELSEETFENWKANNQQLSILDFTEEE